MVKVGIIDLGTNTFNLLIAEIDEVGGYNPVYRSKVGVKLGEGGFEKNYITEEAMERAMIALEAQIAAIQNQYCDRILAFATSAVRNATNGKVFVQRVSERFGVKIRVIDGDQEASMIFQGVQLAGSLSSENSLIMDIGGGSTEFIVANEEEIIWKQSYELGVSRLLEKFEPSNPLLPTEKEKIMGYLKDNISEVFKVLKREKVKIFIGSSGSFDTLHDILAHRVGTFEPESTQSTFDFDMEKLDHLLDELIVSTMADREKMPGMIAMRINMIVMSALLVKIIFQNSDFEKAKLSRYALKEGVLFDVLKGNL